MKALTMMDWSGISSLSFSISPGSKSVSVLVKIPVPSLPPMVRLELPPLGRLTVMDPNKVWMPGPLLSLDSNPRREMDISS